MAAMRMSAQTAATNRYTNMETTTSNKQNRASRTMQTNTKRKPNQGTTNNKTATKNKNSK